MYFFLSFGSIAPAPYPLPTGEGETMRIEFLAGERTDG